MDSISRAFFKSSILIQDLTDAEDSIYIRDTSSGSNNTSSSRFSHINKTINFHYTNSHLNVNFVPIGDTIESLGLGEASIAIRQTNNNNDNNDNNQLLQSPESDVAESVAGYALQYINSGFVFPSEPVDHYHEVSEGIPHNEPTLHVDNSEIDIAPDNNNDAIVLTNDIQGLNSGEGTSRDFRQVDGTPIDDRHNHDNFGNHYDVDLDNDVSHPTSAHNLHRGSTWRSRRTLTRYNSFSSLKQHGDPNPSNTSTKRFKNPFATFYHKMARHILRKSSKVPPPPPSHGRDTGNHRNNLSGPFESELQTSDQSHYHSPQRHDHNDPHYQNSGNTTTSDGGNGDSGDGRDDGDGEDTTISDESSSGSDHERLSEFRRSISRSRTWTSKAKRHKSSHSKFPKISLERLFTYRKRDGMVEFNPKKIVKAQLDCVDDDDASYDLAISKSRPTSGLISAVLSHGIVPIRKDSADEMKNAKLRHELSLQQHARRTVHSRNASIGSNDSFYFVSNHPDSQSFVGGTSAINEFNNPNSNNLSAAVSFEGMEDTDFNIPIAAINLSLMSRRHTRERQQRPQIVVSSDGHGNGERVVSVFRSNTDGHHHALRGQIPFPQVMLSSRRSNTVRDTGRNGNNAAIASHLQIHQTRVRIFRSLLTRVVSRSDYSDIQRDDNLRSRNAPETVSLMPDLDVYYSRSFRNWVKKFKFKSKQSPEQREKSLAELAKQRSQDLMDMLGVENGAEGIS